MSDVITEATKDLREIKKAAEAVATKHLVESLLPDVRGYIRQKLFEASEGEVEPAGEGENAPITVELEPRDDDGTPVERPAAPVPAPKAPVAPEGEGESDLQMEPEFSPEIEHEAAAEGETPEHEAAEQEAVPEEKPEGEDEVAEAVAYALREATKEDDVKDEKITVTEAELRRAVRKALREMQFPRDEGGVKDMEPGWDPDKETDLIDSIDDKGFEEIEPSAAKNWVPEARRRMMRRRIAERRLAQRGRTLRETREVVRDRPVRREAPVVAPRINLAARQALRESKLMNHQMGLLLRASTEFGLKREQLKSLAEALDRATDKQTADTIYKLFEGKMKAKRVVAENREPREVLNEDRARVRRLIGLKQ